MRLLYLTPANGTHPHTFRTLNFFASQGCDVHLATTASWERAPADSLHDRVVVHPPLGEFHLKRLPLTLATIRRLRDLLRAERIQILHAMFVGSNCWFGALTRFHPYVVSVMGADLEARGWRPASLRERWLTPMALHRADALTAWSPGLLEVARPLVRSGIRMEVIHGGVDVTLFHPAADGDWLRRRLGLAPSQPLILSPRLLRPLYNIDVIVRGFARVRANRPDARLVLLRGRHSHAAYANEILGLIGNLGLTASTAIVDEIPNRDMPGAYTAASVTVSIPSIDGTPMTALESMACGRPVVMGSLQDYDPCLFRPDETVAMTDPRQPDALAAAVLRVLDDAYYRQTLVQNALRIVHQHARDDLQMERLQRLYARLLADGESAP